ncbi:MAG: GTP cyclohydrolase FolE2 [Candidatus Melainabacteria bacterium]
MTAADASSRPLLDVQNLPDTRQVPITWVGISHVEMPIQVMQKDGKPQHVQAVCRMNVGLPADVKGTHMSRFIEELRDWSRNNVLTLNLYAFLGDLKERLKAETAQVEVAFRYFVDKPSPATDGSAPMAYGCKLTATLDEADNHELLMSVVVPVTTLCPCSKEISQYGAHNQRSEIRADLLVNHAREQRVLWLEDLIAALEETASCPVYPLLKRPDEKYVTERAYENPKFVEDVIRDATLLLRDYDGIDGFSLEVEAFESIHGHNAWARHAENFQSFGMS